MRVRTARIRDLPTMVALFNVDRHHPLDVSDSVTLATRLAAGSWIWAKPVAWRALPR